MGLWRDRDVPGKLGILLLIALTIFVSAVRPLARASGRLNFPPGMIRMSLLSVPAADGDTTLPSPATAEAVDSIIVAPLLGSVLLLVLKTRRAAHHPVPIRRLKLPRRSTAVSLSSD